MSVVGLGDHVAGQHHLVQVAPADPADGLGDGGLPLPPRSAPPSANRTPRGGASGRRVDQRLGATAIGADLGQPAATVAPADHRLRDDQHRLACGVLRVEDEAAERHQAGARRSMIEFGDDLGVADQIATTTRPPRRCWPACAGPPRRSRPARRRAAPRRTRPARAAGPAADPGRRSRRSGPAAAAGSDPTGHGASVAVANPVTRPICVDRSRRIVRHDDRRSPAPEVADPAHGAAASAGRGGGRPGRRRRRTRRGRSARPGGLADPRGRLDPDRRGADTGQGVRGPDLRQLRQADPGRQHRRGAAGLRRRARPDRLAPPTRWRWSASALLGVAGMVAARRPRLARSTRIPSLVAGVVGVLALSFLTRPAPSAGDSPIAYGPARSRRTPAARHCRAWPLLAAVGGAGGLALDRVRQARIAARRALGLPAPDVAGACRSRAGSRSRA